MQQITVNLDPPYLIVGNGPDAHFHPCQGSQIHDILSVLGCNHWPLRDCVIKLVIADDDRRLEQLENILCIESHPNGATAA